MIEVVGMFDVPTNVTIISMCPSILRGMHSDFLVSRKWHSARWLLRGFVPRNRFLCTSSFRSHESALMPQKVKKNHSAIPPPSPTRVSSDSKEILARFVASDIFFGVYFPIRFPCFPALRKLNGWWSRAHLPMTVSSHFCQSIRSTSLEFRVFPFPARPRFWAIIF